MLNTPVLLIVFNRPDTTKQVFARIREAQPQQLFVAADGPRADKSSDKEKCEEVRKLVLNSIDWECEIHTLFRDENRGCGRGPAEAITWFFENVEQGIILEDDCLPAQSFFKFCDQLLDVYKNDNRIMHIAGTNTLGSWKADISDYHFSVYAGIWGWATWRRAWKYFDYSLKGWSNIQLRELLKSQLVSQDDYEYRSKKFNETFNDPTTINWWDYQWHFARLSQSGLGIVPSQNLISNIGFGNDATHTFDERSPHAKNKVQEIKLPVRINPRVVCDRQYDELMIRKNEAVPKKTFFSRLINKIKFAKSIFQVIG
jgi:hypothetical protein